MELIPTLLVARCAVLRRCYGECTGISFSDSTPLAGCHNRRIPQHRTFAGIAQRGKPSVGWFFGVKLHLIVHARGELWVARLTAGNVDDRVPLPKRVQRLWGKRFGDKGYRSAPLTARLRQRGVRLITHLKATMKNRLLLLSAQLLLRRRFLETITDQLKNISQLEPTRHRSRANLMVNLVAGLIAYGHQPKQPALALDLPQLEALIPN